MKKLLIFCLILVVLIIVGCVVNGETPVKRLHVYWDEYQPGDAIDSAVTHFQLWSCNSLGEVDTMVCDSVPIYGVRYPVDIPADGKIHNFIARAYALWEGEIRIASWGNIADTLMLDERKPKALQGMKLAD